MAITLMALRRGAVALLIPALLFTSGCGASATSGQTSGGGAGAPADARAESEEGAGKAYPQEAPGVPVTERKLIKQAAVSIKVTDLADATGAVRAVAVANGGYVTSEDISLDSSDDDHYSTVVISVPADKLDAALSSLGKVGTLTTQSISTQDVTQQVIDIDSRVKTLRAAVARMQALMAKAERISDIVVIEGELSQRQADLESLLAQQKALQESVAMSPISVTLIRPGQQAAPRDGFLGGLQAGWKALVTSTRMLVTLLGALIPFALLAGLIAAPLVVWRRRRRARLGPSAVRSPQPAPAPVTPPQPTPPAPSAPPAQQAPTPARPSPDEGTTE